MAWTYSHWVTVSTQASRVTTLRAHIDEVSQRVGQEVTADGKSVSSTAMQKYLDSLMKRLDQEERKLSAGSGGGQVSRVKFGSIGAGGTL
jgi:hypothetical protein